MTRAFLLAFSVSLVATLLATPVARRAALKLHFVDRPSDRKLHSAPVPYLGGAAIVFGLCAALFAGSALGEGPSLVGNLAPVLAGGLTLAVMGLWDDRKVVPGWIKVPVELGLGTLLYVTGSRADLFPFAPLDFLVTVAWVIGVTNAVNYMDNMDGLSSGTVAVAAATFTILAGLSGQLPVGALSAALAGCALGFLWYNRRPAKIFMGDAGSLCLGFLLAGLGLEIRVDNLAELAFLVPVAVLAVPVLDALLVSVSRSMRGLSPIRPGKDHISHRLTALGLQPAMAVRVLWLASAVSGSVGVVLAHADISTAYLLLVSMALAGLFFSFVLLRVHP